MTIESWLENMGLGKYRDLFITHDIDLDMVGTLTEDELEKMGIASLGHRKKIIRAIRRLETDNDDLPGNRYDNQVELRDYLIIIQENFRFYIGTVILFSLFFWVYKGVIYFDNTSPVSQYTSLINLSFPGYDRGEYPNGSPFSIEDIISSSVLTKVYKKQGLDPSSVPLNKFIKAFKISYISSEQDMIKAAYKKRIDLIDEKLKLVEIDKIQAELKEELDKTSRAQVLLQFEKNKRWPLRDEDVRALLEDVPVIWKENSINEKGVFTTAVTRYEVESLFEFEHIFGEVDSVSVTDLRAGEELKSSKPGVSNTVWNTEPLIGLEILKTNITYFNQYLADVQLIPNVYNYKTSDGKSISDIVKETAEIENFIVPNLIFSYSQLGIYKDSVQVSLFYDSQIFQLKKEMDLLSQKSDVITKVMDTYSETILEGGEQNTGVQSSSTATIPQLDDSFLRDIIDLAGKGDDMAFKKSLMEEMKDYRLQQAEINSEIRTLDQLKKNLENSKRTANQYLYEEKIKARTKNTVKRLAALLEKTQELEQRTGLANFLDRSMYSNLGYNKKDDLLPEVMSLGNIKSYIIGISVVLMGVTAMVILKAYMKEGAVV